MYSGKMPLLRPPARYTQVSRTTSAGFLSSRMATKGWHRCTRSAAAYSLSAGGVERIKFKTIETGALALRPRRSGRCVLKELDDFSVRPLTEGQPHGSRFRYALDDDILRFDRDHHPHPRARSTAASQLSVRRAKWMMHPSGFGSADPLAKISR